MVLKNLLSNLCVNLSINCIRHARNLDFYSRLYIAQTHTTCLLYSNVLNLLCCTLVDECFENLLCTSSDTACSHTDDDMDIFSVSISSINFCLLAFSKSAKCFKCHFSH